MRISRRFGVIQKDSFLGIFVMLYILYTFWFQYAAFEVPGMLAILGMIIFSLTIIDIKNLGKYTNLIPLIVFWILLLGISLLKGSISIKYTFEIAKYLIPCVGLFTYATKSEKYFRKILFVIALACVFLAVSLCIKGEVNQEGARQLIGLNTNQASNFLTIGFFSTLFLIDLKKVITPQNICYVVFGVMMCIAQILCASRRGFIIMIFLLTSYIFCYLSIILKNKYAMKIIVIFMILLVIVFLFSTYGSVFADSAIVRRLSGENTTGDLARARYQTIAFQMFKMSPLIGNGLGAVEEVAGAYSHSLYYELLACTGITGFLLVMGYLFYMIKKTWSLKRHFMKYIRENAFQACFVMLFVVSLFVSGIAMVFIYESYFYIVIAIICSYIYIYSTLIGE